MIKSTKVIMDKTDEILCAFQIGMSNSFLDAINARVQAAKGLARGYLSKHYPQTVVYLAPGTMMGSLPA